MLLAKALQLSTVARTLYRATVHHTYYRFLPFSLSRITSSSFVNVERPQRRGGYEVPKDKPRLIILDKNGTLIHFHSTWTPWVENLAKRLEAATGLSLERQVYDKLNVCIFTKKARSGVLSQGTASQIKRVLEDLLQDAGLCRRHAQLAVETCWSECDTSEPRTVQELADFQILFQRLKQEQVRVAICTSDTRNTTHKTLSKLNLISHVDLLACGDDASFVPKPSPSNVHLICKTLDVNPRDTVVIGDSEADMQMGREAGVGAVLGVLSGVGTRLDLDTYADRLVDSVGEAVSYVMDRNDGSWRTKKKTYKSPTKTKASLVIFDKDGTLLCFHSMWTPYAISLVKRLEDATGLQLHHRLMAELGYCHKSEQWRPGVFAEGTVVQNLDRIKDFLKDEGLGEIEAAKVLKKAWEEADNSAHNLNVKPLDNPSALFRTLKAFGVKIAICTSDSRRGTEQFVRSLNAEPYIDMMICGDDPDSKPKPLPYNALNICRKLGVDPAEAVVVGDTVADLGMGKSAKVGATVAVLSGVGQVADLETEADHVVPSIRHVIPIVIAKGDTDQIMPAKEDKNMATVHAEGDSIVHHVTPSADVTLVKDETRTVSKPKVESGSVTGFEEESKQVGSVKDDQTKVAPVTSPPDKITPCTKCACSGVTTYHKEADAIMSRDEASSKVVQSKEQEKKVDKSKPNHVTSPKI